MMFVIKICHSQHNKIIKFTSYSVLKDIPKQENHFFHNPSQLELWAWQFLPGTWSSNLHPNLRSKKTKTFFLILYLSFVLRVCVCLLWAICSVLTFFSHLPMYLLKIRYFNHCKGNGCLVVLAPWLLQTASTINYC